MTDKHMIPVLAGGGTRLPAHVGILTALEQMNYRVDRLVGVSGGSIVAALYARGFSTTYLKKLAFDVDFRQFRGFSLKKLLFAGGLSSGERFESWLDDQWRNTVVVETGDISPIEFAMTVAQKEDLFRRGLETASSVIPLKLESGRAALPARANP